MYIFTLLLTHFAPKSVIHSRHSVSLKYFWKSTTRSYRKKMSSISKFFQLCKVSLCRELTTDLDAKYCKISVKMRAINFNKILFTIVLFCMNGRLSKIPLVHSYVMTRTVHFDPSCRFESVPPL